MSSFNIGDIVEIMHMRVAPYHYGEVVEIIETIHKDIRRLKLKHFSDNNFTFTTLTLSSDIILILPSDKVEPGEKGDIIRVLNKLR
jgi:hypothetical protein